MTRPLDRTRPTTCTPLDSGCACLTCVPHLPSPPVSLAPGARHELTPSNPTMGARPADPCRPAVSDQPGVAPPRRSSQGLGRGPRRVRAPRRQRARPGRHGRADAARNPPAVPLRLGLGVDRPRRRHHDPAGHPAQLADDARLRSQRPRPQHLLRVIDSARCVPSLRSARCGLVAAADSPSCSVSRPAQCPLVLAHAPSSAPFDR